jgi:hypothetical protein
LLVIAKRMGLAAEIDIQDWFGWFLCII